MDISRRILGRCALILACQLPAMLPPTAAAAPLFPLATIEPVDDAACRRLEMQRVLSPSAPVRCDQLAIARFSYFDFDGKIHDDGRIMVMAAAARHVQAIFDALLERRFPIAHARLMEAYQGDDDASMRDNNTSGFNDRSITGGSSASLHAYGLAIDLNPVQNPYIRFDGEGRAAYSPPAGSGYANRLEPRPAKPPRRGMAEDAVQIFAEHGFVIWGGYWDSPIDYQHFQVPRELAAKLAALPADEAQQLYERYVERLQACLREHAGTSMPQVLLPCVDRSYPRPGSR